MKGAMITVTKYVRFLNKKEAAEYSGMTQQEFNGACPIIPELRAQGRKVWDVYKLDKWLDGDSKSDSGNSKRDEALAQL